MSAKHQIVVEISMEDIEKLLEKEGVPAEDLPEAAKFTLEVLEQSGNTILKQHAEKFYKRRFLKPQTLFFKYLKRKQKRFF